MSEKKQTIAIRDDLKQSLHNAAPESINSIYNLDQKIAAFTQGMVESIERLGFDTIVMDVDKQTEHVLALVADQDNIVVNMDVITNNVVIAGNHIPVQVSRFFESRDSTYGYPSIRPEFIANLGKNVEMYFGSIAYTILRAAKERNAKRIVMVDDDTMTGRVFMPIISRLEGLTDLPILQVSLAVDSIGGSPEQFNMYVDDVLDVRDFFAGAPFGGLVCFDRSYRVPYHHGHIDLTKRSIFNEEQAIALTNDINHLQHRLFSGASDFAIKSPYTNWVLSH